MNKSPIRDSAKQSIGKSGCKPDKQSLNLDAVLSVDEYRQILNDKTSSSEQIKQRIQFLEAFCRNIIRLELEKHAK
jgi:hypothetical protein